MQKKYQWQKESRLSRDFSRHKWIADYKKSVQNLGRLSPSPAIQGENELTLRTAQTMRLGALERLYDRSQVVHLTRGIDKVNRHRVSVGGTLSVNKSVAAETSR